MKRFFDDAETISQSEREVDYSQKLSHMVKLGYEHSERVRDTFDTLGLKPEDFHSIADLEKLPIISREQVIDYELQNLPYGGFCRAEAEIDRIFTSPGPVYEPHLTEKDPLWRRGYSAAGFGKGDIVLNTFSYHLVAAGLTFHEGLRATGATVVPSGTSSTEIQVQLINHLNVTGYTGTPSFLMAIITKAEEMGYDFKKDFTIRKASFVAEPLQPSLRQKFEEEYGMDTYQMYGATEVGDIAYECSEKSGWHICEEVIVEIVDPISGKCVEPGQLGEVVVTRLNDIFFLFRFGTGDLSSLMVKPCQCGRTSYKINGIAGRVGDAVKVRGLFIAPSQLNTIKEHFKEIKFQLVITRESYRDHVTAIIETDKDEHRLVERFEKYFQSICTVKIDAIKKVEPGNISDSDKLLIDRRIWE
jgi:phenylacetate-CoA ligase